MAFQIIFFLLGIRMTRSMAAGVCTEGFLVCRGMKRHMSIREQDHHKKVKEN